MSYAHIVMRQHMDEKPSDEFMGRQRHGLLFIVISMVPPAEGNLSILESKDAVIADGDPMGIPAEGL